METPSNPRYLSTTPESHAPPQASGKSGPSVPAPLNYALSQRGARRHPIGLAVVVVVHVLLAAAILTARLDAGPPALVQVALTKVDAPPRPKPKPQQLPDAPRTPLHPLETPVPEVVFDRPDALQAATPTAAPALPGPASPAPATGDTGSSLPPVEARAVRINAGDASCRPQYPHIAEREGVTGITKLRFTVDAAGHVSAQLLQTSGPLRQNRRMDEAAIEALSQCPVTVGTDEFGRPVGGTVDVNYKWSIYSGY